MYLEKMYIFEYLMKFRLIFYCLLFIFSFSGAQQIPEKGIPLVRNYLPEEYGNHGKIWDISSAKNGLVYLASENGLLEFDGKKWSKYRDYKGYTRSLFIANDSTIYVGADMDFGVWKKNKFRKFDYQSLYPFKTKIGGVNEEFWGTYRYQNQIVFVSHQNLYRYEDHKITKIPAPERFFNSFQEGGRVFLADEKKGLYEYDGKNLRLLFAYPKGEALEISGIYLDANAIKIITRDKGIYLFSKGKLQSLRMEISEEIIRNKVFSFSSISRQYLVFGTILNGIYITDLKGNIIQHLNKNKGLPNNTILSLHYQDNGTLWMGLDYGLSKTDIAKTITYFQNTNSDFGTGYTAALKNQIFYLGTNQGLYYSDWNDLDNRNDKNPFKIIHGAEGQVWTLGEIDGKILCGHDRGLFEIDGYAFRKIHYEPGVMSMLKYNENTLFTGNYNGISIFKKEQDTWKFQEKMPVIMGAINQIVQEQDHILWVNIPNYGLIRFELNDALIPISKTIIPTKSFKGYFPYLYKDQYGIHVITSTHQYRYQVQQNNFIAEKNKIKFKEINNKLTGFYLPIQLNQDYGFYAVNNGFAIEKYLPRKEAKIQNAAISFRDCKAFNNEKAMDLYDGIKIPFRFNNLRISFMVPNASEVQYQYYLEGFSDDWTEYGEQHELEFLGLREGHYQLSVRAKIGEQVLPVKKFSISIASPWYRSIWSYIIYFLVFMGIVHLLRQLHEKRLRRQKRELLEKERKSLQEQAEKHRQEMLLEKQKQLEVEVRNKTVELATKAKDDDDKNRILHIIGEKISEAENNPNISKLRLGEIRRMVKSYLETEDHTFEIQMDELHQEFFKAMKKRYPNLSIYDLRLCAYLKIGLNSKEMADIFQVLPSSINVSRSRLRKKMNLSPDEDLYEFLNSVK